MLLRRQLLAERLASIWRRPLGRRDASNPPGVASPGRCFNLAAALGRRDLVDHPFAGPLVVLQSGGGLLAAGTDLRSRRPAVPGSSASIWRRPLGRRDTCASRSTGTSTRGFNLAATSWPPGRGDADRELAAEAGASIWRRPLGRRDARRVPAPLSQARASIWRRPLGRRDDVGLCAGRLQRLASIWRRPLGRRDIIAIPRSFRASVWLQSGGGLLAAGTRSGSRTRRRRSSCFNLAAASWPPGRATATWRRCRGASFNLAAASWPPGHAQTGAWCRFTGMLQSGGGLLAAGTRPRELLIGRRRHASIWRRPLGRRDALRRRGDAAVGRASIWRRPLGRRDLFQRPGVALLLRASIWRRPLGRRDPRDALHPQVRLDASIWRRPLGRRDSCDGPKTVAWCPLLQSGGGLLAAGTTAQHQPAGGLRVASIWRRPLGRRDALVASISTFGAMLQSGGGLLAAGTWLSRLGVRRHEAASIWRRPLGRRDIRTEERVGAGRRASIWRRPLGRRDPTMPGCPTAG